ncbi:MAG TPA: MFS transporter [Stellaceae bacterium]|nr:MFS transporter [Stellaceae bacterium]
MTRETFRTRVLLNKVVAATVAVQIVIVMASLTVPVLASLIAPAIGVPAYLVGYYSGLIYLLAVLSSFATPRLVRRWGGIRLHQFMLVMTAAALLALLPALPAGFVLSGIVLGAAYGPMNPASTVLLARYTPSHLRSRVFSLKQTAVPVGGALAGLATPLVAATLGWRGAIAAIAAICLVLSVVIQPWRDEIDRDEAEAAPRVASAYWLPVRLLVDNAGLRSVTLASFAFGSVQFSFTAVFPTMLAHVGWTTTEAGRAMSIALVVGVAFRGILGTVADKVGSRPVLGAMGVMMAAAAFGAAFVGAAWPGWAVALIAALFGLSAFCWAGIGIAEAVRQVPPHLVAEASAGIIGFTFFGALAGPTLFSAVTGLTGGAAPAFIVLAVLSAAGGVLMLRPMPQPVTAE